MIDLKLIVIVFLIFCLGVYFLYKKYFQDKSFHNRKYDTKITDLHKNKFNAPYIKNNKIDTNKLFSKKNISFHRLEKNLKLLKCVLEKHSIEYYIDCGTLLGAVREKYFIKGDTDADIMVSSDGVKQIRSILPELEQLGFISFRNSDSWMAMSLFRNGEYIDVYALWKRIPFGLVDYQFLGTTYPIPKFYDDYLTELYGTWEIPKYGGKGLGNWEKGMPSYVKKHSFVGKDIQSKV